MSDLPNVNEITEADFQRRVVDRSHEVPVLVDFWADWCAPCKMLLPVLLQLAADYGSQLEIVKINTDQERTLAGQHGIRSLPTLRLYRRGEVVEEVLGAQPESVLRTMIDVYIERESDRLMQQALEFKEQGNRPRALELLETAYREDPDNPRVSLEYVRLCLEEGELDQAQEILEGLPRELREQPDASGLQNLLEFARATATAPPPESLAATLEAEPNQSAPRYQLAALQALAGDYDASLENFLQLLKSDRAYGDGAAQRGLLAIFALLGDDDERVMRYRRQMFALLH
jgi:putative thioredoxin